MQRAHGRALAAATKSFEAAIRAGAKMSEIAGSTPALRR